LYEADRLKRIVRDQQLEFAVYDSVAFACHEAPETAEAAIAYFRAVRQIGVGSLHVAHINKAEGGDMKPFGSAFWFNGVRALWNIKASEAADGLLTLGLFNRKTNLRARQAPFSLDVSFTDTRTTFRRSEITKVEAFVDTLSVSQRLQAVLKT